MVFKSDRQRKAVMAKLKPSIKSDVQPQIIDIGVSERKEELKLKLKKKELIENLNTKKTEILKINTKILKLRKIRVMKAQTFIRRM